MSRSEWQTGPNGERVETGIFTHEGREFASGGALVTATHAIGYPHFAVDSMSRFHAGVGSLTPLEAIDDIGARGELRAWSGEVLGMCRVVGRWPVRSHWASHMLQVEATIDGRTYTGRGFGNGMLWRGKVKKGGAR